MTLSEQFLELICLTRLYFFQENPEKMIAPQKLMEAPKAKAQEQKKSPLPPPMPSQPIPKAEKVSEKKGYTKDFQNFFSENFPSIEIVNKIPSDEKAKKITSSWKEKLKADVFMIVDAAESTNQSFFANVHRAIQTHYPHLTTLLLTEMPDQEKLEFSDATLFLFSKKFAEQMRTACKLIILEDAHVYLADPKKKSVLWKTIQKNLKF